MNVGACDDDPDKFVWNEFEQWSKATLARRAKGRKPGVTGEDFSPSNRVGRTNSSKNSEIEAALSK